MKYSFPLTNTGKGGQISGKERRMCKFPLTDSSISEKERRMYKFPLTNSSFELDSQAVFRKLEALFARKGVNRQRGKADVSIPAKG
jgi:hypothetical protein